MLCSQLISQLQNIQGQYQELNREIDSFVELKNSKTSTKAKSEYLLGLYQSRKELRKLIKELQREFFNPTIETKNYITVEGQPTQETEIKIDFETILNKATTFYQKHEINLPSDFEVRAKKIWTKNYEAIQKEIATYGYDHVLIIPDNLPPLSELHNRMTAGYSPSYQNVTFQNNGSFSKAKNSKKKDNLFRLVLSHNVQNLEDHLLLKATKGNSPEFLIGMNMTDIISGTSKDYIEATIARKGELPIAIKLKNIKFGPDQLTKNNTFRAEGLTLAEYLIFQRQYFEVVSKHLDEKGWTWLLSTYSAHCLTSAGWNLGIRAFTVDAYAAGVFADDLGCRPCRSFSL